MLVMTVYVLASALHGFCDLDVPNASDRTIISLVGKDVGHSSEKGVVADHHRHGCFSVSVSTPVTAGVELKVAREANLLRDIQRHGLLPGLDPPPPKSLI
ncbi:hypothetical protein [Bradyrhizobium neotropicale]|uniref:hypothetical protein n=1 Tax=Bradyrhizobium neotropicale TaxID=1497615 RepID=UPI001AD644A5|nr:hypothetical protein [Bradyrhizobium neotropicale]MBO4221625.1 hypothetical protein [Bradyrhizobium neotropicale]